MNYPKFMECKLVSEIALGRDWIPGKRAYAAL